MAHSVQLTTFRELFGNATGRSCGHRVRNAQAKRMQGREAQRLQDGYGTRGADHRAQERQSNSRSEYPKTCTSSPNVTPSRSNNKKSMPREKRPGRLVRYYFERHRHRLIRSESDHVPTRRGNEEQLEKGPVSQWSSKTSERRRGSRVDPAGGTPRSKSQRIKRHNGSEQGKPAGRKSRRP